MSLAMSFAQFKQMRAIIDGRRARPTVSDQSLAAGLTTEVEWWQNEFATTVSNSPANRPTARPSWDDYLFGIARQVATRATCPRASIGVVIVDRDHRILSTGYNGAPAGEDHCLDVGCTIFANHCVRATHGEVNAVAGLPSVITYQDGPIISRTVTTAELGLVAYGVGHREVCSHCARTMHDAGITEVKWRTA